MNYAFPHILFTTCYLNSEGKPAFRPHERNPRAMWHKPVPKYAGWYFIGYRWVTLEDNMRALELVRHIEPEAHYKDERLYQALSTAEAEAFIDKMNAEERAFSKVHVSKLRSEAIKHIVNKFRIKFGIARLEDNAVMLKDGADVSKIDAQIMEAVATMFDVGTLTVRRALGLHYQPAKSGPVRNEFTNDPKWPYLRWAINNARGMASGIDIKNAGASKVYGQFESADVLIKHRQEYLYPETCPVLGLPLVYNRNDTSPRGKDVQARVGRLDVMKPFESGNVTVMSSLAVRLIEGTYKPELLTADFGERWLEWKGAHNVMPTSTYARGKRPKAGV